MAEMVETSIDSSQYLSFYLKNERYAVNVSHVREIIEYTQITKVPMMQDSIAGVTNIRGNVIPVLDLSERLGLGLSAVDKKSCIITIETLIEEEEMEVGIIVDMVDQVYEVSSDNRRDAPEFGSKVRKDFMQMMAKVDGKFITMLEMGKILDIDELSLLTHRNS